MDLISKINQNKTQILKLAGLALITIILLSLAFRLTGSSFRSILNTNKSALTMQGAPGYGGVAMDQAYAESSLSYNDGMVGLSVRNASPSMPPEPINDIVTGDNAEDFEVTQYNGTIETRNLTNTCASVSNLKTKDYVIFENANEYDKGCNYTFKVRRANVEEILNLIKSLDPKELSENTYTIKKRIEDFTSETEILEKQLDSIDKTLKDAISAYDDITALATKTQNADALAKIIDSKIGIIERLTQQKIYTSAQLERLQRAKDQQLDRLEYTYFYINIFENKFADYDDLKDSWKLAIKEFVRDVNKTLQNVSVGLVALIILTAQYAIYLLLLVLAAKYGWKLVKHIWNK